MSLAISSCHFGIAKISFFALDYKFTTKLISHSKLLMSHGLTTLGVIEPILAETTPEKHETLIN
jgi:hypothetical protein